MADAPGAVFNEAFTEVRYGETDQMGYAHHSTFVFWFELGRVHWLREYGLSYRKLEASGVLLPVTAMTIRYHAPGRFEDPIVIRTRLAKVTKVRVVFENEVLRVEKDGSRTLLASGSVDLACLDREGRVQRLPKSLTSLGERLRVNG
ncbi:MAG TPA: thioesterase family protein [Planctomycetota bacterium]|jgi:acyl-CoA thioester hydrolase